MIYINTLEYVIYEPNKVTTPLHIVHYPFEISFSR